MEAEFELPVELDWLSLRVTGELAKNPAWTSALSLSLLLKSVKGTYLINKLDSKAGRIRADCFPCDSLGRGSALPY